MLPEECRTCTRGFIPIHPHVTIIVEEDGSIRVPPIEPRGVDVTFDIIDEADGGVYEPTVSERTLCCILDELHEGWQTFSWYSWTFDEEWQVGDFHIDGSLLSYDERKTLEAELQKEDIQLLNWNVQEVRRHDIAE
jgi:hypothetical protein